MRCAPAGSVLCSIEARWREVVTARIADVLPVRIALHTRQSDVSRGRQVGDVEPHGDVSQSCPLNFVQRGSIAEAERVHGDVFLVRPGMHHEDSILIGAHEHARAAHAEHHRTHAIDEADIFL